METPSQDRLANYDFVISILWIGFILAISVLETPLRFQAESITLPIALQVGQLIFHALNYCELLFAVLIFICQFRNRSSQGTRRLFFLALLFLAVQTLLLFLFLDGRTESIISDHGQEVVSAPYHTIYIGCESCKLLILVFLAKSQIDDFKSNLSRINSA